MTVLSRSRSYATLILGVLLSFFLVTALAPAAQADKDRDGPEVSEVNSTTAQVTNTNTTQTQTHPTPTTTNNNTPSSTSSSSSSSSSSPSGLWLNNSNGSACDPSNYPGGYSEDFAVPSPCIQPTGCYNGQPTGNTALVADCDEEQPVAPVITTQMVTEAARVTAPVVPPNVEPGTLSFVNIPNNYWADAPTVNDAVTVLGVTIPLRWTPTGTTWNFGDGASATGNGVEGADVGQAGAIEHAYARQGSYDITTTTTYDLTFVLPGGGTQTVQLEAPPSPPVTLPVREIQTLTNWVG